MHEECLLLQQRRVLRIGAFYRNGVKQHFFVFKHGMTSIRLVLCTVPLPDRNIQTSCKAQHLGRGIAAPEVLFVCRQGKAVSR